MENLKGYNLWSSQYDKVENKTRDLEALSLKLTLSNLSFDSCMEVGCGTGKNTIWLIEKAKELTAIDFSEGMIKEARKKVTTGKIEFIIADITRDWNFGNKLFDVITFSLILEHIENLDHIFRNAYRYLKPGGYIYIGELHPYKQYKGSKAKFNIGSDTNILDCYTHNISEFISTAQKYNLQITLVNEFFDDKNSPPRILTLMFKK